jgi:4-carboxymuconolactone decarboxylase
LKTRELLTFAMLASLSGCEPQLAGHVTGNVAMGKSVIAPTVSSIGTSGSGHAGR